MPDHDVVVGRERGELVLADVDVGQHELDAGVLTHPGQQAGQQQLGSGREDRQVDRAGRAAEVLLPGRVHRRDGGGDPGGQSGEDPAVVGQSHAATDAFDQRDADLALQGPELLRHRARRPVGGRGDGGDGPAFLQLAEHRQQRDVEPDHAGTLQRRCPNVRWSFRVGCGTIDGCCSVTVSSRSSSPSSGA